MTKYLFISQYPSLRTMLLQPATQSPNRQEQEISGNCFGCHPQTMAACSRIPTAIITGEQCAIVQIRLPSNLSGSYEPLTNDRGRAMPNTSDATGSVRFIAAPRATPTQPKMKMHTRSAAAISSGCAGTIPYPKDGHTNGERNSKRCHHNWWPAPANQGHERVNRRQRQHGGSTDSYSRATATALRIPEDGKAAKTSPLTTR